MEQERELDRQRMAFFSAASHELKTPVTILKGQLSGMLEGVGVYRDRDKYLLRALQVAGRMEVLVRELLTVSRMESELEGAGSRIESAVDSMVDPDSSHREDQASPSPNPEPR